MAGTRHALPAADASWLHMDRPENLMVINAVMWTDEPLAVGALREVLQTRLVDRFPRFHQRIVETATGPAFEDDPNFDLALHVHHLALPKPNDRRALQEAVQDLMARSLDRSRPLWDIYLFDDYHHGSAIYSRMHHCIADGIALSRVLLSLTDLDDASVQVAEPHAQGNGGHGLIHDITKPFGGLAGIGLSAASTVAKEGLQTLAHPGHVEELAKTAAQDAGTLAKLLLAPPDADTALRGELHVPNRVAWSAPVSVRTVRHAAHGLGVTINDLVVSAVAGTARHYLEAEGETPPDELHAMVPFNLRPLDEPLDPELGNRFGLILLGLPTGIEDQRERIAESKRRMDAIKHSHEGPITYGIIAAMGLTPPRVEGTLLDFFSAKSSMVVTNVPGPQREVHLAGVPIKGVLVWAPCSGSVPMSVSVLSYAGKITVGFLTDAGLVPDPQVLANGFREELLAASRLVG
ncbi:MAG: wax ester/triacylglycerol synthase family O-acyltransferase [Solirubrobacteraceae bacterium]